MTAVMAAGGKIGGMQEAADVVHIAGVLVRVAPGAVRSVTGWRNRPASGPTSPTRPPGQLVVTIDAPTLESVRAIHEAIGRVPGVLLAPLVCHIADPGAAGPAHAGGES